MWVSVSKMALALSVILEVYCQVEDYYKTLGLQDTASIPEVKKAFRNLAKTMHPDKNKQPGAEAKFRKILEAYEVLSDESQKQRYDAMRRGGRGNSGGSFNFGQGTRARNFDFDFDELFKQFESDIWDDHFGGSKEAKRQHFHSHFSSHFEAHSKHFQGGFDSGMGDFFHEFDDDTNNLFGDMNSFFGDLDVESHSRQQSQHTHKRRQQKCHTVKQKIGNTVTTYTQCS